MPLPSQGPQAGHLGGAQGVYAGAGQGGAAGGERLGFGLGALVVAGAVGLGYVLPVFGVILTLAGLVWLGTRDRIRSAGGTVGGALGAALWRAVLAFVVAGVVAWGLEALLEPVAGHQFRAGLWTGLRDTPTSTVLAVFTGLTVLLACAVPRWRAPSRALARLVTGGDGATPVLRYGLIGVCALLIIAALFAPEPAWWPLPFDSAVTFGDVLL